jgi:hypothetical protein
MSKGQSLQVFRPMRNSPTCGSSWCYIQIAHGHWHRFLDRTRLISLWIAFSRGLEYQQCLICCLKYIALSIYSYAAQVGCRTARTTSLHERGSGTNPSICSSWTFSPLRKVHLLPPTSCVASSHLWSARSRCASTSMGIQNGAARIGLKFDRVLEQMVQTARRHANGQPLASFNVQLGNLSAHMTINMQSGACMYVRSHLGPDHYSPMMDAFAAVLEPLGAADMCYEAL